MISGLPISGDPVSGTPGAFVSPLSTINITTIAQNLQLPVNCVLDGQQREPVSKLMGLNGAISGPLKGIFGE